MPAPDRPPLNARPSSASGPAKREQTVSWKAQAQRLRAAVGRSTGSPSGAAMDLALKALASGRFTVAVERAREALKADPGRGVAWRLMALGFEGQGDPVAALDAYQAAYEADPGSQDLLADIGRMAGALGAYDVAAQVFARALAAEPGSAHLSGQLAMALRGGHKYGEAIEVLRGAIMADVENAFLWNALGSVVLQQGDTDNALIFFEQALTLAPDGIEALCNRARARLELGGPDGALADCEAALRLAKAEQKPAILFIRALARLSRGDLARGWSDYEARLNADFEKTPTFSLPGRRWAADDNLDGKRLLVVGEQGLGDEIMFAGMIPDVVEALGPAGLLSLAVAPRLVALFERSFPRASVCAHETGSLAGRPLRTAPAADDAPDLWAPMGSLMRRFRSELSRFDGAGAYLRPDPDKADFWRRTLASVDGRPKIGVSWKSMKTYGDRLKQYAPFAAWESVLRTPGVRFVNLQYGECDAELAQARAFGVEIWDPPGLDLTNDIDAAAALSSVLDLVIGVGNASTNLAAAVGIPVWISSPPFAWPRLGADDYPWFPKTRVFAAERFGEWDPITAAIARDLTAKFPPA